MSASRAVPPLGEWPLIGRAIELEAFERALSRPTCAAVVLYGEAGVGKSRLADTFLASADEMGHPTARVLASAAAANSRRVIAVNIGPLPLRRPYEAGDLSVENRRADPRLQAAVSRPPCRRAITLTTN